MFLDAHYLYNQKCLANIKRSHSKGTEHNDRRQLNHTEPIILSLSLPTTPPTSTATTNTLNCCSSYKHKQTTTSQSGNASVKHNGVSNLNCHICNLIFIIKRQQQHIQHTQEIKQPLLPQINQNASNRTPSLTTNYKKCTKQGSLSNLSKRQVSSTSILPFDTQF